MLLSVEQAAQILGMRSSRVRFYIAKGRLVATLVGSTWVIDSRDLDAFAAIPRVVGWPKGHPAGAEHGRRAAAGRWGKRTDTAQDSP